MLATLWLYDRWVQGLLRLASGWIVLFVLLFAGCCLLARRLHDIGRSGWWGFAYFGAFLWAWPHPRGAVALLLALAALELALRPGQPRPNRFGPPLSR